MQSVLVLLHQGPAKDETASGPSFSYLIDPTQEETQNLSNNLVLVTLVTKVAQMEVDIGDAEPQQSACIVEKVADALRTCHSVQLSSGLAFKPCAMTLAQLRQAVTLGKSVASRLTSAYRSKFNEQAFTLTMI